MIKYDELLAGGNHRWIHLENPDKKEVEFMTDNYGVPHDFISDIYDPFEVARSEYLETDNECPKLLLIEYVHLKNNHTENEEFITLPLSIVIVNNRVITVANDTPDLLKEIHEKYFTTETAGIDDVQHFILEIFHHNEKRFIRALRRIFGRIERLSVDVQHSTGNKILYRQIAVEKSIVVLRDGVTSNRRVIEKVRKYPLLELTDDHRSKMHDVLVESHQAGQMAQTCFSLAEHLSGLFDNVISNNLNTIMKTLTSFTIIMTIPTIIGGLWGMNVTLPIENHPHAFTISIFVIAFISIVTYAWLKKNDYL